MTSRGGGHRQMDKTNYIRKHKEDRPVIAMCYDFDKTLSPDDMQAQGYIQSVGYDVDEFWAETNVLSKEKRRREEWRLKLKKVRFQFGKNICLRWMKQCNISE